MDINKLTQKTQEALQAAQNHATRLGQVEVDAEHLLLALVEQDGGLLSSVLKKMDVRPDAVAADVGRPRGSTSRALTGRPGPRCPR